MDRWAERQDQTVWSYRAPGYKHKSSVEHDGELRTYRQEQWIDAVFGDEDFNSTIVTVTENKQNFVKGAVVFQRFKTRHEIGIRVTDIVEEIGQDGKANFFFDTWNTVPGFDYDHRDEHFIAQLRVPQLDQLEDVEMVDGM